MGTLVLFLLVNFHEFTGYAYIILYSHTIFEEIGSESFTPRQANYLIGVVNFLATVASAFIIKKVGRRTLLIPGHIIMGVINIVAAIASRFDQDVIMVISILLFLVAYQIFNGPIIWLYISEVPVDTAMGFITLSLWVSQFIIALIAPFLNTAIGP
jgi:MFS transporter, SP family, arabinose:H+ symporter